MQINAMVRQEVRTRKRSTRMRQEVRARERQKGPSHHLGQVREAHHLGKMREGRAREPKKGPSHHLGQVREAHHLGKMLEGVALLRMRALMVTLRVQRYLHLGFRCK